MNKQDWPSGRTPVRPGHGPFGPGLPSPPLRRCEQPLSLPNVRQHLAPSQLLPEGHLRPHWDQE
eukprot:741238-Prorocentrum_minimum.AAC.1